MKATTLFIILGTMLLMVAAPGTASAVPVSSTLLPATTGTTLTAYATGTCDSCSSAYSSAYSGCNRNCSLAGNIVGTSFGVALGLACVGLSLGVNGGTVCVFAGVAVNNAIGEGARRLCEARDQRCRDRARRDYMLCIGGPCN